MQDTQIISPMKGMYQRKIFLLPIEMTVQGCSEGNLFLEKEEKENDNRRKRRRRPQILLPYNGIRIEMEDPTEVN